MTDPVSPESSSSRPLPLLQRLMGWSQRRRLLTDASLLRLYPPFWAMRIKVIEMTPDWSRVRVRLPLTVISRNPGGIMFGGFQAALADPIAALACLRRFPGQSVWTRSMSIDFEHGGDTDLELRFEFTAEQDAAIREQLAATGRATPTFEYGFYLTDGRRCSVIRNTVAIRPKGYRVKPPSGRAAS